MASIGLKSDNDGTVESDSTWPESVCESSSQRQGDGPAQTTSETVRAARKRESRRLRRRKKRAKASPRDHDERRVDMVNEADIFPTILEPDRMLRTNPGYVGRQDRGQHYSEGNGRSHREQGLLQHEYKILEGPFL